MNRVNLPGECLAEFIGTALLLMIIVGVSAAFTLTDVVFGQWELALISGLAFSIGLYVAGGVSNAHLNPAITIAMAVFRDFHAHKVIPYILAQTAGAFVGAGLIYGLYYPLFLEFHSINNIVPGTFDSLVTASIFSTYALPQLSNVQAAIVEATGTAILVCAMLAVKDDCDSTSKSGLLLIGLVVAIIGGALGPLTGAALNPARDFGPRIFEFLAGWGDIAFSSGRVDPYFWVPIVGPVLGGCLGAFVYVHGIDKRLGDVTLQVAVEPVRNEKFKKAV